ncbi:Nuclear pore complex nucleoporin component [Malassezia brasiliensis]|uniref:mRNA export factor GLE1 n=1 Tax=Malassezia brasiliensis TaxID=1821822 RepID=A0AAF0DP68_9BASI|nr:Nuclear pore complex nucleoporin component [Malassezia brasiliensis]
MPARAARAERAPRMDALAPRKPTGRYVYESSEDESDTDPVNWRDVPRPKWWADLASDEDEDDDTDEDEHAADLSAVRLANELDPWEAWEAESRRRAWRPILHQGPVRVRHASTPRAADHSVQEVSELLSHFQLQQKEAERIERESFDQRNASLWEGIEQAIRDAEKRAAHEAEQLAHARKRQEQAEAEAKRAREAELARIEREKRAAEEEKARAAAKEKELAELAQKEGVYNTMRGGERIWPIAAKEYAHWQAEMRTIKEEILPAVAANPAWRKQCFAAKRAITPKIGQLTNSRAEIARITNAIATVLQEAKDAPDTQAQRFLYYWTLNHLAKGLIRQAEQEVAARQETAYPLARTALGLMLRGHGELGHVLMARLVKKCPYILGYVPERPANTDEHTYRKMLGFRPDMEESTHMYVSRMAGIAALYFACLQTALPSVAQCSGLLPSVTLADAAQAVPDVLRPARLWTWQVRCTTPPVARQSLVPSLWCTFLEVAGIAAQERYGRQVHKLWALLLEEGVRRKQLGPTEAQGDQEALQAARVRLQLLLESWQKTHSLAEHASAGREME